jgi:hypothetical protein
MTASEEESRDDADNDSIFCLPLSILPLANQSLKKARLIKNSQLQGVVELFSGDGTGSGQMFPKDLGGVFQFDEDSEKDLEIVTQVGILPSYDVYSLRIELRKLDIDVDNIENLRLSPDQARRLNANMQGFITPLMTSVFGAEVGHARGVKDLVTLIQSTDQAKARENLMMLSKRLGVHYTVIPNFLQDYGDVYMSLAYYQYCLDRVKPGLGYFFECLNQIRDNRHIGGNDGLSRVCEEVSVKFHEMYDETQHVLTLFRAMTDDMWVNISGDKFQEVESSIRDYQTKIGGALCALTVKTHAWNAEFPDRDRRNSARQAAFVVSDMRQGIENVEPIGYSTETAC